MVNQDKNLPCPNDEERSLRLSPIERVRFGIAVGILSGFGVFMLIPVVAFILNVWFITNMNIDGAIRLITTLSAATSGLVGAVVGYYFGQELKRLALPRRQSAGYSSDREVRYVN